MAASPPDVAASPPDARLLEAVLEALPFYVLLVDETHTVLYANQATREALQLTPEQIVGTYCPEAVHGTKDPYPGCPLEEAAGLPVTVEREFFEERAGIWVSSAVYPTARKIAGKTVYAHIVQPIVERKRAEQALVERVTLETMIGEITTRLLRSPPEGIAVEFGRTVAATAEFMSCDECAFYLVGDGPQLDEVASWTADGRPGSLPHGLPASVLPATTEEPRHREALLASLASVLDGDTLARTSVVPIILDGSPAGVGLFLCAEADNPRLQDDRWMELLGNTFSAAWQRVRDVERQERYAAQLRSMAMELAAAEARERRRLATDLHDGIGQTLALAIMNMTNLQSGELPKEAARVLSETCTHLEDALVGAKALMFDLCPPSLHELGIGGAIEALLEQAGPRFELDWELVYDGCMLPLSDDHRAFLFRAVRELVNNVHKHAQASRVVVELKRVGADGVIEVADDGVGMPKPTSPNGTRSTGFGLFSIEERLRHIGGRLGTSSPGNGGARITLTFPLAETAAEDSAATQQEAL